MTIKFCWGAEFSHESSYELSGFAYDYGATAPDTRSNVVPEMIHMSVKLLADDNRAGSGAQFLSIAKDSLAVHDQPDKTSGVILVFMEDDPAETNAKPVYEVKFEEAWITDIQASLNAGQSLPMEMRVSVRPRIITAHGVTLKAQRPRT